MYFLKLNILLNLKDLMSFCLFSVSVSLDMQSASEIPPIFKIATYVMQVNSRKC